VGSLVFDISTKEKAQKKKFTKETLGEAKEPVLGGERNPLLLLIHQRERAPRTGRGRKMDAKTHGGPPVPGRGVAQESKGKPENALNRLSEKRVSSPKKNLSISRNLPQENGHLRGGRKP